VSPFAARDCEALLAYPSQQNQGSSTGPKNYMNSLLLRLPLTLCHYSCMKVSRGNSPISNHQLLHAIRDSELRRNRSDLSFTLRNQLNRPHAIRRVSNASSEATKIATWNLQNLTFPLSSLGQFECRQWMRHAHLSLPSKFGSDRSSIADVKIVGANRECSSGVWT
jgi:hypothetical protein